ncbi:MAG: hypothetical protein N3B16_09115 [Candidatus Aminicenantes bacterium]|nr:hypothetical protein [Candidatus Aminicenantes bacterium]
MKLKEGKNKQEKKNIIDFLLITLIFLLVCPRLVFPGPLLWIQLNFHQNFSFFSRIDLTEFSAFKFGRNESSVFKQDVWSRGQEIKVAQDFEGITQENQARGREEKSRSERVIKAEFKNIKEKISVYVFLGWLWLVIGILMYILHEQIKEADKRRRLGL